MNAEQAGAYAPLLPPRVHRGSGMKARPPGSGGREARPRRPQGASFSGPSSRTKAGEAVGAGAFVSGALGAALLAAAALLLAPGEARAAGECGSAITLPITCTDTSYPDGIFYGGSDDNNHPRGNGAINVAGSSTATTTITSTSRMVVSGGTTTTSPSVGIYVYGLGGSRVWNDLNVGVTVDSMGEMTDAGHVVDIVQGTSTNNAADRNNGIYFQHRSQMGDSTVRVGRGVTIGSETTPMQQNGIFYHPRGLSSWGGGKATLISAATIFAAKQGIRLFRNPSNVYHPTFRRISDTTITNSGAIRSGEEGIYLYFARPAGGAVHLGDATITNTGAITVSGARYGIFMDYRGYGATEIDNAGTIAAATGSGIHLAHNNNGTVTLTNSGDVDAATVGLRLSKYNGTGTATFTNSGRVTVTADAAAEAGHALWLQEVGLVTGGPATITNSGVLSSKNHALYAEMSAANAAVLTLTNEAAIASADGDGIRLARGVEGDVTVTNSADVSGRWHGVYVGRATRIDFDQTAGTISGRTGVYAEVSSASASGDTRSTDGDGNHDPAIDVAWTGGSIARGTAANDQGRFRAASAAQALSFDQESAAVKAVAGSVRWGAAAGIEAHALSWRDVAAQVAKGDDPGAFADNAAQTAAVPTGATASGNAYVKQFRAALENGDLTVAPAVLTAIGTTATTAATDLTDTQIVTYLQTDDAATRTLLRNVLAQGLSDDEKSILRAVAAGDDAGVDAALTAAGFSDDTSDPNDYWSLVKALLDRYNIDDVRIAMTAGSIDSRGDGIRAYYATQHDSNGGISVTVAAGATVTGGTAGIYVANAGPDLMLARKYTYGYAMGDTADELVAVTYGEGADAVALRNQLVTVAGTVTGGTDAAVRLSGGGAVIVMEGGKVHAAGASGVGILADGPALVYVDGEVKGGEGGAAAVRLSGGGIVTVGPNGRVQANGAGHAIRGGGDATTMVALTLVTERLVPYREDVNAQLAGSLAGVENVVRLREDRDGVPTGYSTSLTVTADGRLDTSKLPPRPASIIDCAADGPCRITQAETISDRRTGVYAAVPRASESGEARAAADQPLIDVTWTGTFSHAEGSSDEGRFTAETVGEALVFDRESAAVKAVEETVRWDAPAGIEAHALSWRDVATQVAKGDDPGAIADNTAQMNLLSTTHADSRRAAILAQLRAALGNADLSVPNVVLTAIDSTAMSVSDLSDAEIVAYLSTDDAPTRVLLRNVLVQGLSDKEKAVLAAVAAGDATALTTALDDADPAFDNAYKTAVRALLDRYNVGDIRIAMNGGSIDSRGDGIRAYYATPHDDNGGISVTVAEGASVTGAMAGIYVANAGGDVTVSNSGTVKGGTYGIYAANAAANGAIEVTVAAGASVTGDTAGVYAANAGPGLMLARKYTPGYDEDDNPDEVVPVMHGEGADAVPLLNQLVRVHGTVTGGTDAAVHLNGGGAVLVMEGGRVHAGSSGVGILVNDPGPALVHVEGEVKGGEGGAAAVHLTGGGSIIVGLTGKVQDNGADHAIRSDGTEATTLTLVTDSVYRDSAAAANSRVEGSLEGIEKVRYREDRDGVPTGYSTSLTVPDNGLLGASKFPPQPGEQLDCAADGRCVIDQGETISDRRTGVYAAVPRASEPGETRAAADQPLIDVTWTGTFSHAEGSSDEGRFEAETVGEALSFDRESAAGKAVEETIRWDAPAGIEAHALSWRDVAAQVAKGDDPDPDATMTNTEQMNLLSETHADSERAAIVAQFRAALGNDEIEVASSVITAIGSTATTAAELTDDEIVTYLGTDDGVTRALLRNVLAQGLSEKEKAVLEAVAAGDSADLTTALDDADAGFTAAYKTAVRALLDRYNVGDVHVAVNEGSITATRGDGIRAYYATPHDMNGGISVTVAAGTTVTGGEAGVYVANAGPGLMLEKKYTPGYAPGDAPDELVAVTHGEGAEAVPLLDQLVTVAGTVTGGTDAAVHLNGGGAVLVMEGGKVHAGASGVAIKVNDPGPALVYIDGEVRGRVPGEGEAPAPAAVHLPGGGSVIVGLNGKVEANGAARAIQGGGDAKTMVTLTLVTGGIIEYREDAEEANARVEGSIAGIEKVRYREDRDGVPTGYAKELPVQDDGDLPGDLSGLPSRPEPEPEEPEPTGPGTDSTVDGIRVVVAAGGTVSRDDGIRAYYETPHDDNGGIEVTVAEGASVSGSVAGIYVANAGPGLRIPKRYAPKAIQELKANEDAGKDDLIAIGGLNAAGDAIATPYLNQLVTIAGTVTGGTDAAVHLVGGGAVIVMKGGRVHAGSSGVAIKVNDPGPALMYIDGEVKGGAGGAAAVHLTGGGSVIIGLNGKVEANGAARAIRGGGDEATKVALTLVTDDVIMYREDADEAYDARVEGSLADVDEVRFRRDRDGVPTGYSSRTLPVDANGMLDPSELPSSMFSCEEAGDRRCRLYEALPSMLLAMNGLPSYAERTSAVRDGNGGWARVETARGEWQAKKAETETMGGGKLAYDHRRSVGRAGVDFLAGESARVGVSVHALRGKAEMGGVGEVELDGMGGGLSATWLVGGLYVDAQAAVTLYDVDVESSTHGKMPKKDVYGAGYGLGVDVGRRMSVGGMFVTPRAGVGWSKVELDDFTDMERFGGPRARVSVEDGVSVKGRLGVMLEMEVGSGGTSGQVFGSLDVEGEFSDETEVRVGGEMLKTEVRPTAVRLGLGGEFAVDDGVVVRATGGFRTSGSGTSGYGGGLELRVRF